MNTQPPVNIAISAQDTLQIAIRMADEGVPIRAIARATKLSSSDIRETLEEARDSGVIVEVPRDDWPVNAKREDRLPEFTQLGSEDVLYLNMVRFFRVTKQEASIFLALIKRREVMKTQLHAIIEARRVKSPKESTNDKIVDVVICKLRKKLRNYGLNICTVWACGYLMPPEDRKKALELLNDFMGTSNSIKVEEAIE